MLLVLFLLAAAGGELASVSAAPRQDVLAAAHSTSSSKGSAAAATLLQSAGRAGGSTSLCLAAARLPMEGAKQGDATTEAAARLAAAEPPCRRGRSRMLTPSALQPTARTGINKQEREELIWLRKLHGNPNPALLVKPPEASDQESGDDQMGLDPNLEKDDSRKRWQVEREHLEQRISSIKRMAAPAEYLLESLKKDQAQVDVLDGLLASSKPLPAKLAKARTRLARTRKSLETTTADRKEADKMAEQFRAKSAELQDKESECIGAVERAVQEVADLEEEQRLARGADADSEDKCDAAVATSHAPEASGLDLTTMSKEQRAELFERLRKLEEDPTHEEVVGKSPKRMRSTLDVDEMDAMDVFDNADAEIMQREG